MALFRGVKGGFDIKAGIVKIIIVMALRVIFMGTPEFAVPSLESLVHSSYQVIAVYTQPDKHSGRGQRVAFPRIKEVAIFEGIQVVQPATLNNAGVANQVAGLAPDLIVVAAFGRILPREILAIPKFGCINVHPSLLPDYRGASPVATAILRGDEVTGITIMLMDSGMDTGPILAQREVTISAEDTNGSLTAKLAQDGAHLLMETLPSWLEGNIELQPQNEERASYTEVITREDSRIDWHLPALNLWWRIRAFNPWPGCYTWWQGKKLRISRAIPLAGGEGEKGEVIGLPPSAPAVVGVKAGEGILGLLSVQLEGKRDIPAEEFVRGQRGFIGTVLL